MPARNVKRHVDDWLKANPAISSGELARELGMSRQAAHAHLRRAVQEGWLRLEGLGRAARYVPARPCFGYPIASSAEDRILADVQQHDPSLLALEGEEGRLLRYAFTEMVNNALDHSDGRRVTVRPSVSSQRIELIIEDDGIGAFERVRAARGLANLVEAAAELTKGKVTTQPERHSGEGIFFTCRATDRFELQANGLELLVDRPTGDLAIRALAETRPGTRVRLVLERPVTRRLVDVFAEHTIDLAFARTRTVVRLFGLGVDFVSRSEARRLLAGLEQFQEVVLDFDGVAGIGQGFADEVFRVFATAHPATRLLPVNMNEPVRFFVKRAGG